MSRSHGDQSGGTTDLRDYIREIPVVPRAGTSFKDITPLLRNADAFRRAIDALTDRYRGARVDTVVSPDSRGFVVGAPVAYLLGAGFALARRVDVLPWETISAEYTSHRGRNIIEMHTDAVAPGERVLIVDDLLATGGTVSATARLVRKLGGEVVGVGSLIELGSHGGRERLRDFRVESVIRYE